jgi:hypothetical protein
MNKRLLTVLASALVLVSCGDMTQSVETTVIPATTLPPEVNMEVIDEMNLEIIKEMYPKEYELYGRQSILDLGNMACNSVDYGTTVDDIAKLALEYGIDSGFLGAVYGRWIPSHCPENEAKFLNEPQPTSDTQQSA